MSTCLSTAATIPTITSAAFCRISRPTESRSSRSGHQEDADTGRTVGGSVVINTKHGTNDWHGSAAFYDRTAGMSARFPIDNPAPEPKQPFSRQNYVATLGGPLKRDRLWVFASFEAVDEDASISYSPASQSQFNALAGL